jgi:hypothetical protein
MTIKEILEAWLKENGYDGLCYPDYDCGCRLEDLMPCCEPSGYCEAGHKRKPPADSEYSDADWLIYSGKAEQEEGEKDG